MEITPHGDPVEEGKEAQPLNPRVPNKKEKTSIYSPGLSHPASPLVIDNESITCHFTTFATLHSLRGEIRIQTLVCLTPKPLFFLPSMIAPRT